MANKTYKFKTKSVGETENFGCYIAKTLDESSFGSAFIALRGEMGVGKTAFARGFAQYFGIKNVKSPTYSILNEYRGKANIFHFDTYRIDTEDDLISIGYDDYLKRPGYIICEWSEKIDEFLPYDCIFLSVNRVPGEESERNIELSLRGKTQNLSFEEKFRYDNTWL